MQAASAGLTDACQGSDSDGLHVWVTQEIDFESWQRFTETKMAVVSRNIQMSTHIFPLGYFFKTATSK